MLVQGLWDLKMGGFKYKQLNTNADATDFTYTENQAYVKNKSVKPIFKTLGLISIYFTLSIGLTFYQRWLVKVSLLILYIYI